MSDSTDFLKCLSHGKPAALLLMSILQLPCSYTCIGQGLGTRLPLAPTDGCGRAAETAKQSENAETQRPFK